jgi:hypothetical protein
VNRAPVALAPAALGVAAVVLAVALGGCGSNLYIGPDGPDPAANPMLCTQPPGEVSGMQVLMAQSVPAASAVPCLHQRLDNWMVSTFDAARGGTTIEFSYRFGESETATIEVRPRCDMHGAKEVASEHAGAQRFDLEVQRGKLYADERYYTHPGVCTSLRFHLTGANASLRGAELGGVLGFVSRESLDRRIREATDHHLRLDPGR